MIAAWKKLPLVFIRMRAMADDHALEFPVIAVNDAMTKHFFDNAYGSANQPWMVLFAPPIFCWLAKCLWWQLRWCGRGLAMRCTRYGAIVVVTEVDPCPRWKQ
jgi:adenosylhomocysteinase